jgi:hypothetical protein
MYVVKSHKKAIVDFLLELFLLFAYLRDMKDKIVFLGAWGRKGIAVFIQFLWPWSTIPEII